MGKARKTWAIILIVIGAFLFITTFGDVKEMWPMFFLALVPVLIGVLMLRKGMKQVREQKEKMEELNRIEKELQERHRTFNFDVAMAEKFQKPLEKLYAQQNSGKEGTHMPKCEIVSYDTADYDTRYNVMVDDKKIGEVPEDKYEDVEAFEEGVEPTVLIIALREMKEDGYVYKANVSVSYYEDYE